MNRWESVWTCVWMVWACVWMNWWAFRLMHQGSTMIPHKINGVTSHCCPPKEKKTGIWAHTWRCQSNPGLMCKGTTVFPSKNDGVTVTVKHQMYIHIFIWAHMSISPRSTSSWADASKEAPGTPVTCHGYLDWGGETVSFHKSGYLPFSVSVSSPIHSYTCPECTYTYVYVCMYVYVHSGHVYEWLGELFLMGIVSLYRVCSTGLR